MIGREIERCGLKRVANKDHAVPTHGVCIQRLRIEDKQAAARLRGFIPQREKQGARETFAPVEKASGYPVVLHPKQKPPSLDLVRRDDRPGSAQMVEEQRLLSLAQDSQKLFRLRLVGLARGVYDVLEVSMEARPQGPAIALAAVPQPRPSSASRKLAR